LFRLVKLINNYYLNYYDTKIDRYDISILLYYDIIILLRHFFIARCKKMLYNINRKIKLFSRACREKNNFPLLFFDNGSIREGVN